jgi:hypothetical protein
VKERRKLKARKTRVNERRIFMREKKEVKERWTSHAKKSARPPPESQQMTLQQSAKPPPQKK